MAATHRYIANTALPYVSNTNVVTEGLYFRDGSNVMTSVNNTAERRPGFPVYTTDAFTFNIKRFFAWKRWGGDWYVMANTTSATTGTSQVRKQQVGTDSDLSNIVFTSSVDTAFDFVVSNNTTYYGNGEDMRKYNATTESKWGIATPAAVVTTSLITSGSLTSTIGYLYVACFKNSTTGHVSSPSPVLAARVSATSQNINVSGNTSTDPQVDQVALFRTTDGGSIYFEHPSSPVAYATWVASGLTDSSADTALTSVQAPLHGFNNPPPRGKSCVWYAGRIWTTSSDRVNFSGFEEINIGVKEEAWPEFNFYPMGAETTGLGVTENALMMFTANDVFRLTGDSLDTFRRETAFRNAGTYQHPTITGNGKIVAWLDAKNVIRITDGYSMEEISIPIRPDIKSIVQASAQMAFYDNGIYQWLVLMDGGAGKLRVYDLDTGQWMVPWDISNITAIHQGDTAQGTVKLFLGRAGKPLALNATAYADETVAYSAYLTTNAFSLLPEAPPSAMANFERIVVERDAHAISSIGLLVDEDPGTGSPSFTSLNGPIAPTNQTQGTNLVEDGYWSLDNIPSVSRYASAKISWTASAQNFRLYSVDVVTKVVGDTDI